MKRKLTKTSQEITNLTKAAQLTTIAFQQIIKKLKLKQFKTENDIKRFLKEFAKQHHTKFSFPPIIATNKNTNKPHHKTSDQSLQKGFLLLDFGICYQNYCSDMTRMLYLGRPTKNELALYNFLLKIQIQAIKNLKVNQKFQEIETQTRKDLSKYNSHFIHSLGHGLGKRIHEAPNFRQPRYTIQTNQVFTIEPGLYFKKFGLRIEDTILMKQKPVILTKTTKKLLILPIP